MENKIASKSELKPGIISKEIFDREVLLCGKLSEKNGGKCSWGECEKCGVIPLLVKLYEGNLLEDSREIAAAKSSCFSASNSVISA